VIYFSPFLQTRTILGITDCFKSEIHLSRNSKAYNLDSHLNVSHPHLSTYFNTIKANKTNKLPFHGARPQLWSQLLGRNGVIVFSAAQHRELFGSPGTQQIGSHQAVAYEVTQLPITSQTWEDSNVYQKHTRPMLNVTND
jgi:hypothetical protein